MLSSTPLNIFFFMFCERILFSPPSLSDALGHSLLDRPATGHTASRKLLVQ